MKNKWQRKVDALILLAEDQKGKPEGDLAREKLLLIVKNHPEAVRYQPLVDLAHRDMSTRDVVDMHRRGISTDGVWEGATLWEALDNMMKDYHARAFGVSPLEDEQVKDYYIRTLDSPFDLFANWVKDHADEPSATSPLNTPPEVEEDHKEPPEPLDTDVPV